jgi:ADP-heptose:LPS heptosyltransferase
LAGIKKVIGTGYFEQQRLDYSVPRPLPKIETEHEFFLKSLEYENVPIADREFLKPELLLTDQEREKAARWLTANCGFERKESNKMPIAVSPSSKWPSKIWAEDRYAEVIGRLIREKNVFPIIFGGAEDREKGERLLKIWGTGANAAGELNVREAAAALAECRVLIGNDSGTMHLAASVGTPCLGIFSALDWFGRWEPFGDKNTIFRAKVECEGCLLEVCPRQNQCLDRISAESVTQAALKTLEDIK